MGLGTYGDKFATCCSWPSAQGCMLARRCLKVSGKNGFANIIRIDIAHSDARDGGSLRCVHIVSH